MKQDELNPSVVAFLNAYMIQRSVPDTMALLSDDICWVGCGNNEKAYGLHKVREMLLQDVSASPSPIIWEMLDYYELPLGREALAIACVLKLTDSANEHQLADIRVSFSCLKTDNAYKICTIHGSVATDLQESNSFFPVSRAEINLKQNLLDSQKELTVLMETVQAGIAVLQYQDGRLMPLYFNQGLCRLMHSTVEEINEIYQTDAYSGVHPEDKERVMAAYEQSVIHLTKVNEIYRLRNQRGEYAWVNVNAVPTARADGSLYYYVVYTDITSERRMLEEARVREEAINVAVEQTGINIWVLDLATRAISQRRNCLLVNEFLEAAQIENVPESFILADCVYKDDISTLRQMYEEIYRGKPHAECTLRWKSNHKADYIWLRTIYTTVFDEKGKPLKAIGSALDVTEQMSLQQKYREFEAYQYLMLDTSFAAYKVNVTRDALEEAIRFSGNLTKMAKAKTIAELCALSRLNIPDEKDKNRHKQVFDCKALRKAFETGKAHIEFECRYQIEETICHWVRIVMNLTQNPTTGDIIGFTYANDIHDEKLMESVVEHMLQQDFDRVICIDVPTRKFRILEHLEDGSNSFAQTSNDYDETLIRKAKNYIHPEDWHLYSEGIKLPNLCKQLDGQGSYELIIRGYLPSGELRVKKYAFSYLDSGQNTILFTRSDITQTVQEQSKINEQMQNALEEAKRANAAKSEFLSRMSHDMRTPMNGIIGLAGLALELPDRTPKITEHLQGIQASGRYLLSLINDVLDMSKIESNMLALHLEPALSRQIMEEILVPIQTMADKKQVTLTLRCINTSPNGYINVDKVRLQQILINILSNAVKFTPGGGKIEWIIECLHLKNGIRHDRITIRDNGIGMSTAFLPKIFKPFEQEKDSISTAYTGTGLGMPIVKSLVEAMGGKIEVHSEKGVGTEVVILLDFPVVSPPQPEEDKERIRQLDLAGKRVLLCEDHPINMQISRALLEKKGVLVTTAANGQEGVEAFFVSAEHFYDAVLMDIRMPVMDGLTATRAIRALPRADAKTVPIIAMTANAFDEDAQKSLDAGMNAHLAKPIEPQRLYQTLAKYMDGKDESHELHSV